MKKVFIVIKIPGLVPRLSNVVMADRILIIENGRLIEQGTHDELIEKDGRYAYLFNLQAKRYINSNRVSSPET